MQWRPETAEDFRAAQERTHDRGERRAAQDQAHDTAILAQRRLEEARKRLADAEGRETSLARARQELEAAEFAAQSAAASYEAARVPFEPSPAERRRAEQAARNTLASLHRSQLQNFRENLRLSRLQVDHWGKAVAEAEAGLRANGG